jgi:hypothetical protein
MMSKSFAEMVKKRKQKSHDFGSLEVKQCNFFQGKRVFRLNIFSPDPWPFARLLFSSATLLAIVDPRQAARTIFSPIGYDTTKQYDAKTNKRNHKYTRTESDHKLIDKRRIRNTLLQ